MILKGKEVAQAVQLNTTKIIEECLSLGLVPTLALFKVGNKESDTSYEKSIIKKCEELNIKVISYSFEENVDIDAFYQKLEEANSNDKIHGILVFRPLEKRFDNDRLRNFINPDKDVDGCGDLSLAGVFTNSNVGFPPCTAQAVLEMLDYYHIELQSKNVVILGRSLVIGKPVSMMLLNRNATVTICHTKTKDMPAIAKKADILVCATGCLNLVTKDFTNSNQTIIDVSINYDSKKQKLCGDCNFDEIVDYVENLSPVPGGIGSVTTSVLLNHVAKAAYRQYTKKDA